MSSSTAGTTRKSGAQGGGAGTATGGIPSAVGAITPTYTNVEVLPGRGRKSKNKKVAATEIAIENPPDDRRSSALAKIARRQGLNAPKEGLGQRLCAHGTQTLHKSSVQETMELRLIT